MENNKQIITRYDYMNLDSEGRQIDNEYHRAPYDRVEGAKRHFNYYSQFVNDRIIQLVIATFGIEKLIEAHAKDEHLNNLGGNQPWDRIEPLIRNYANTNLLKEAKEGWSSCTSICIAKSAARIAIENYKLQSEDI